MFFPQIGKIPFGLRKNENWERRKGGRVGIGKGGGGVDAAHGTDARAPHRDCEYRADRSATMRPNVQRQSNQ